MASDVTIGLASAVAAVLSSKYFDLTGLTLK